MSKPFYITTTTPYVNSDPHLGFALEVVHADILVRYHELLGEEIFFNTGTDEHGLKIYRKAQEAGKSAQEYVDAYAARFKELLPKLNIYSKINFIRTTDAHHKAAAQQFWNRCLANGDIYKKEYEVKYCVGCELEKTDSELVDGKCPIHPNLEVEFIQEENYFFRFSKYQQPLLDYYKRNEQFVVPDFRFNEIRKFVEGGLQDFSVSRLKEKMPWGVAVPGDDAQVMYVWFDALVNYISALGWLGESVELEVQSAKLNSDSGTSALSTQHSAFTRFWGTKENPNGVQIAGKDNLRQQSAMWQAMLMSAGLPNSKQIIIHGFINSGGQKMSKSLGNVIDPFEVVEKYGTDALRYWIAREMSTFEDGDFTWDKFKETYNGNLANGLGNLTSRILKMAVNAGLSSSSNVVEAERGIAHFNSEYSNYLDNYEIQKAADWIWAKIKAADEFIAKEEPFKKVKVDPDAGKKDIEYLLGELAGIAYHAQPFLPDTSAKILAALENITLEAIPRLFPRIE